MSKRNELQQKILEKAMKDEAFKKELMTNPKEALKKEFNIEVPQDIDIKVLEETEKQVYVVIPASPEENTQSNGVWT